MWPFHLLDSSWQKKTKHLYTLKNWKKVWAMLVCCYCCCCHEVTKSCLTLHDPMPHSTPGPPVLHYFLAFTQTHAHCPLYRPTSFFANLSNVSCIFIYDTFLPGSDNPSYLESMLKKIHKVATQETALSHAIFESIWSMHFF